MEKDYTTVSDGLKKIRKGKKESELYPILKSLFIKMGFREVEITHGKDEYGKDLVFNDHNNKINEKIWYAVVVKNKDAEMADFENQGEITRQIRLAFEHPYLDTNGQDQYINKVIVIVNGTISSQARSNIQKVLPPHEHSNVSVWNCQKLETEIETNVKDVFLSGKYKEWKNYALNTSLIKDKQGCLVYDLVGFGKTADIKKDIVEAFILQCLFEKNNMSVEEIIACCSDKFSSGDNNTSFYKNLINRLYNQDRKIDYSKETKQYALTTYQRKEIEQLVNQIKIDEKDFISQIGTVLQSYGVESKIDGVIQELKTLYYKNFTNHSGQTDDSERANITPILKFLTTCVKDEQQGKDLLKQLLLICDKNKYLQKICARSNFSNRIDLNDLQKYAITKKQVFIDANIGLDILCYYYQPKNTYSKTQYILSVALLNYCTKNNIELYIPDRYLWEVQGKVQEALNLVPFTHLPNFTSLGKSRNVFYNFYLFLKNEYEIEESFEEFLNGFDFVVGDSREEQDDKIMGILNNVGIYLQETPSNYPIENTRKIIEDNLFTLKKDKSNFGLNNDASIIEYLADSKDEIHKLDPVFITWDKALFMTQKDLYKKRKYINRWLQFTPTLFIDRYSLLSFSINEEAISKEMLAMLNDDFVDKTYSLVDSLSLIINPNNEVGREYTNRLIEMKDSQIYINKFDNPLDSKGDDDSVDVVFGRITNHYFNSIDERNRFCELFNSFEHFDEIVSIIESAVNSYNQTKVFDENVFISFDKIIETL